MVFYLENGEKAPIERKMIEKIEREYGIRCLFIAAKSSYVYGIQNAVSDRDYIIIAEGGHDQVHIHYEGTDVDFVFMGYDHIMGKQKEYLKNLRDFPSCLYRRSDPETVSENSYRDDYFTEVIFECLASNCIWDSGYLKENFDALLREISVKAVMDYYYTRAYGNWKNNLQKEQVLNHKYMTTLIGICCMKWIAEKGTIPRLNYKALVQEYVPDQYIPFFLDILRKHQNVRAEAKHIMDYHFRSLDARNIVEAKEEKPKAYTAPDREVNDWIQAQLEELKGAFAKMPEDLKFTLTFKQWVEGKGLIWVIL